MDQIPREERSAQSLYPKLDFKAKMKVTKDAQKKVIKIERGTKLKKDLTPNPELDNPIKHPSDSQIRFDADHRKNLASSHVKSKNKAWHGFDGLFKGNQGHNEFLEFSDNDNCRSKNGVKPYNVHKYNTIRRNNTNMLHNSPNSNLFDVKSPNGSKFFQKTPDTEFQNVSNRRFKDLGIPSEHESYSRINSHLLSGNEHLNNLLSPEGCDKGENRVKSEFPGIEISSKTKSYSKGFEQARSSSSTPVSNNSKSLFSSQNIVSDEAENQVIGSQSGSHQAQKSQQSILKKQKERSKSHISMDHIEYSATMDDKCFIDRFLLLNPDFAKEYGKIAIGLYELVVDRILKEWRLYQLKLIYEHHKTNNKYQTTIIQEKAIEYGQILNDDDSSSEEGCSSSESATTLEMDEFSNKRFSEAVSTQEVQDSNYNNKDIDSASLFSDRHLTRANKSFGGIYENGKKDLNVFHMNTRYLDLLKKNQTYHKNLQNEGLIGNIFEYDTQFEKIKRPISDNDFNNIESTGTHNINTSGAMITDNINKIVLETNDKINDSNYEIKNDSLGLNLENTRKMNTIDLKTTYDQRVVSSERANDARAVSSESTFNLNIVGTHITNDAEIISSENNDHMNTLLFESENSTQEKKVPMIDLHHSKCCVQNCNIDHDSDDHLYRRYDFKTGINISCCEKANLLQNTIPNDSRDSNKYILLYYKDIFLFEQKEQVIRKTKSAYRGDPYVLKLRLPPIRLKDSIDALKCFSITESKGTHHYKDSASSISQIGNEMVNNTDRRNEFKEKFSDATNSYDRTELTISECNLTNTQQEVLNYNVQAFEDRIQKKNSSENASNNHKISYENKNKSVKITCDICGLYETSFTNLIVMCNGCLCNYHQDCYGMPNIDRYCRIESIRKSFFFLDRLWFCRKCLFFPGALPKCKYCPAFGNGLKQVHKQRRWGHILCAKFIDTLFFSNDNFLEPIEEMTDDKKERRALKLTQDEYVALKDLQRDWNKISIGANKTDLRIGCGVASRKFSLSYDKLAKLQKIDSTSRSICLNPTREGLFCEISSEKITGDKLRALTLEKNEKIHNDNFIHKINNDFSKNTRMKVGIKTFKSSKSKIASGFNNSCIDSNKKPATEAQNHASHLKNAVTSTKGSEHSIQESHIQSINFSNFEPEIHQRENRDYFEKTLSTENLHGASTVEKLVNRDNIALKINGTKGSASNEKLLSTNSTKSQDPLQLFHFNETSLSNSVNQASINHSHEKSQYCINSPTVPSYMSSQKITHKSNSLNTLGLKNASNGEFSKIFSNEYLKKRFLGTTINARRNTHRVNLDYLFAPNAVGFIHRRSFNQNLIEDRKNNNSENINLSKNITKANKRNINQNMRGENIDEESKSDLSNSEYYDSSTSKRFDEKIFMETLICRICNVWIGRTAKCCYKDCQIKYHVTCGINAGFYFDLANVKTYCLLHDPRKNTFDRYITQKSFSKFNSLSSPIKPNSVSFTTRIDNLKSTKHHVSNNCYRILSTLCRHKNYPNISKPISIRSNTPLKPAQMSFILKVRNLRPRITDFMINRIIATDLCGYNSVAVKFALEICHYFNITRNKFYDTTNFLNSRWRNYRRWDTSRSSYCVKYAFRSQNLCHMFLKRSIRTILFLQLSNTQSKKKVFKKQIDGIEKKGVHKDGNFSGETVIKRFFDSDDSIKDHFASSTYPGLEINKKKYFKLPYDCYSLNNFLEITDLNSLGNISMYGIQYLCYSNTLLVFNNNNDRATTDISDETFESLQVLRPSNLSGKKLSDHTNFQQSVHFLDSQKLYEVWRSSSGCPIVYGFICFLRNEIFRKVLIEIFYKISEGANKSTIFETLYNYGIFKKMYKVQSNKSGFNGKVTFDAHKNHKNCAHHFQVENVATTSTMLSNLRSIIDAYFLNYETFNDLGNLKVDTNTSKANLLSPVKKDSLKGSKLHQRRGITRKSITKDGDMQCKLKNMKSLRNSTIDKDNHKHDLSDKITGPKNLFEKELNHLMSAISSIPCNFPHIAYLDNSLLSDILLCHRQLIHLFKLTTERVQFSIELLEIDRKIMLLSTNYDSYLKNEVINALLSYPDFDIFKEAVTEDIAPGYFSVIKSPMCLDFIFDRVLDVDYSIENTFEDLILIARNCKLYNSGVPYYVSLANRLESAVKKLQKEYM